MLYETIWEQQGVYQRFSYRLINEDRVQANNAVRGNVSFAAYRDALLLRELIDWTANDGR